MPVRAQLKADVENIRARFFRDPTGVRAEEELASLLDDTVSRGWEERTPMSGCAVLAVGGYGRGTLHPSSDLDLLVFFEDQVVEKFVDDLLKPLWDLPFRVGHQIRQASDFEEFDPTQMESYTAFMDARFLWGDSKTADEFIHVAADQSYARHLYGLTVDNIVSTISEKLG